MTDFLSLNDCLELINRLKIGPMRDIGLLNSALQRPGTIIYGKYAYPTLHLQTAALVESLARNHALVDGNKRLAFLALVVFYDINDFELVLDDDSAYQFIIDICIGQHDVQSIAAFLEQCAYPTHLNY